MRHNAHVIALYAKAAESAYEMYEDCTLADDDLTAEYRYRSDGYPTDTDTDTDEA